MGDSTRELTLTLERKDKARGVFLRIVFKRCICTPTGLFITPAENCTHRASCDNLQRQNAADNNDMNNVEAWKNNVSFDLHTLVKVVTLLWPRHCKTL